MSIFSRILSFILFIFIISSCSSPQDADSKLNNTSKQKRYGVKSGILVFELAGHDEGIRTVYFDQWGLLETWDDEIIHTVMGMSEKHHHRTIHIQDFVYEIDLISNTAQQFEIDGLDKQTSNTWEVAKIKQERLYIEQGGVFIGNEIVHSYTCEIWKFENKTFWIWNGITFRTEEETNTDSYTEVVKKINLNATIDPDLFTLPQGIIILNELNTP